MNPKKKLILTLVIIANLSGCTATAEIPAEKNKPMQQQALISQLEASQQELTSKVKKIENQLDEWNKIQPNVQRLAAIETQLNMLISQLNTLAREAQQEQQKATEQQSPKQHLQRAKNKYYMLQLASLNSPESVKETWLAKRAQYPNLLTDLEVRYQHAQIKNKEYYRLKVGKFTSAKEANTVCQALIKQKANCLIAPYSGTPL